LNSVRLSALSIVSVIFQFSQLQISTRQTSFFTVSGVRGAAHGLETYNAAKH